jgi:2-deoxy-D-gluconate 3-dehydrogenase
MNILDTFKLDGKVALVTGANRGLGLAMAVGLAEAGADIIGLNRGANSNETQRQVESLGRRFLHMQLDLATTSIEQLQKTVDQVTIQMGQLDILINNAGIIRRTPALEFAETDWDDVLQVNLKAAFFLSQAAAKKMLKQGGGKIIQIASVLSYQGGIFIPPYAAAKHA